MGTLPFGSLLASPWALPALFVSASLLGLGWRLVWSTREDIFADDAYYYTVVARNLVADGHLTFDGVSRSNGFHPLLLYLQAALAALLPEGTSPGAFYGWLVGISAAILAALLLFVARLAARTRRESDEQALGHALLVAVGVLFWPPFLSTMFNGMESMLLPPLVAVLVVLLARDRFGWAGLVCALLVASRLDTAVYVVAPLGIYYAIERLVRGAGPVAAFRRASAIGAPAAGFALAYVVANQAMFGRGVPISGALKSTFPSVNLQWHQLFQGSGVTLGLIQDPSVWAMAGVGIALALTLLRPRWDSKTATLSLALALVTLASLAGFVLFQRWAKGIPAWYLTLPLFTGVTAAATGVATRVRPGTLRSVCWVVGTVLLALNARSFLGASRYALRNPGFHTQVDEVLAFMAREGPARWASTDCGKLAFWSGQSVVNLDGLINGWDYQERLREGELGEYLRESGVRFLITTIWDDPQAIAEPMYAARIAPDVFEGDYSRHRFWVHSYLHGVDSEALELPRSAEVFRSGAAQDHGPSARAVVFDLEASGWN